MTALPLHHEDSVMIPASAERLFEFADVHASLSAHMGQPSWKMGWGRMEIAPDEDRGKSVGSHIRLDGKILGIRLALDEVVTERNPPQSKAWGTTGSPRLLVIGHYRMGFEITPQRSGSLLRVFIDYALPGSVPARWLGRLLGRYYARWCVRQMLDGAVSHFSDFMTVKEQAGAAFVEALTEALVSANAKPACIPNGSLATLWCWRAGLRKIQDACVRFTGEHCCTTSGRSGYPMPSC